MSIPRKPPFLSVEMLKEELSYNKIIERRRVSHVYKGRVNEILEFEVRPADDSLPCIYLIFDTEVSCLSQYGMGNWHCHFDEYEDERRNIMASIKLTRQLMNHYYCICEEVRAGGEYGGAGVTRPTELPTTLGKDIVHFRRWFFGKPPVIEKIDFSRYIEGNAIYVERNYQAKIERMEEQVQKQMKKKKK